MTSSWECPKCTFLNSSHGDRCEVCDSIDPARRDVASSERVAANNYKRRKKSQNASTKRKVLNDDEEEEEALADVWMTDEPGTTTTTTGKKANASSNRPWNELFRPQSRKELTALVAKQTVDRVVEALENPLAHCLVMHGPVGCGKSETLSIAARELGYTIREWNGDSHILNAFSGTSRIEEFAAFLNSSSYTTVLASATRREIDDPREEDVEKNRKEIVLLESLPSDDSFSSSRLDREATAKRRLVHSILNETLERLRATSATPTRRCVLVIMFSSDGDANGLSDAELLERLGPEVLAQSARIRFSPIAPGRMKKFIERVGREMRIGINERALVQRFLDVAEGGDARSVLNAMQFSALVPPSSSSSSTSTSTSTNNSPPATSGNRDTSYSLMHAVGKLLRANRDAEGRLNFDPETVASACALHPEALASFLHHNMPRFVGDVEDWWRVLDAFSQAAVFGDDPLSRLDASGGADETGTGKKTGLSGGERYAESIIARAPAAYNRTAPLPPGWTPITKPESYEVTRTARDRKNLFLLQLLVPDGGILSFREAVTQIFPMAGTAALATGMTTEDAAVTRATVEAMNSYKRMMRVGTSSAFSTVVSSSNHTSSAGERLDDDDDDPIVEF